MSVQLSRRIGRFYVAAHLIETERPGLHGLFARCTVVRCEFLFHRGAFEYVAICDDFDEVPRYAHEPVYDVIVADGADGGPATISFRQSEFAAW